MEEKYNQFISSLEIVSITVPRLSWELIYPPSNERKMYTNLGLTLEKPEKQADNQVALKANLKVNGLEDNKNAFMEIDVTIRLLITFNPDYYSEEVLSAYIHRNAIFSIMAILREQIRYATFQMGLKPLILPAFKIVPENNKKEMVKQAGRKKRNKAPLDKKDI
ncbi:hypothetical protein ACX8XN_08850 [Calditrichota bacterium GD2]